MGISGVGSNNSGVISNANNNQSQALRTLLTSIENQPTLLDILDESATSSSSSGDILDLSSEGQSAADQLFQLLEAAALGSVQTSANKASESLQHKLDAALAQNGIDTTNEIDLQVDSDGNVVVTNDHPQKQQIEGAINNDPDLKRAVSQYVKLMQAIARGLQNGSSSQSVLDTGLGPSPESLGSGSQGAVMLDLLGNDLTTSYQDGDISVVLAVSQVK
jgi:hypothetical protein